MSRKNTIQDARNLTELKGGKCLSTEYVNNHTKLKWQCSEGHQWWATPNKIQQGKWCPFCAGRRKTIKDMQILASTYGGKCLSKKYIQILKLNLNGSVLLVIDGGHVLVI